MSKTVVTGFSIGQEIDFYIKGLYSLGYESETDFFYYKHRWYLSKTHLSTRIIQAVHDSYEAARQDFHSRTELDQ